MKKIYIFIITILLSFTDFASASSIIQNYTTSTRNLNIYGLGIGQTFSATSTSFSSISVNLFPYPSNSPYPYTGPEDHTILFELHVGLPLSGPMTRLLSEEIDISSLNTTGGKLNIDISAMQFTIGSHYSFSLSNDTSYWSTAITADGYDYYDQGNLFYILEEGKYFPTTINSDMQFSVNTAVPTPSAFLLLATGLSILPIFRKKFRYSGK